MADPAEPDADARKNAHGAGLSKTSPAGGPAATTAAVDSAPQPKGGSGPDSDPTKAGDPAGGSAQSGEDANVGEKSGADKKAASNAAGGVSPATPAGGKGGAKGGAAPTPVVSGTDRIGATPASSPASVTPPTSTGSASQPARPASSTAAAGAAAAASTPYQPSKPQSDWRADKDSARPPKQSALRPLLLGATGGAIVALLLLGLFRTGASHDGNVTPAQNDGKVATALEELEKERAAGTARNSAVQAVEQNAADLNARLSILEQKATTSSPALADAAGDRVKALELKIAGLEAALQSLRSTGQAASTGSSPGRDEAAITGLSRRIDGLERRLAQPDTARIIDPSASRGAERAEPRQAPPPLPPPQTAYAPDGDPQGMRPPGLIPEPERPRVSGPVRGWVLHSVFGGVAVLEGRNAGVVEVRRGQNVPGLGRIAAIERRGDRWIVTTDRGLISSPVQ